jgi:ATP-dependent helicase HrpB
MDIRTRLENLNRENSQRAQAVRHLAGTWAKSVSAKISDGQINQAGEALAFAYPDRIAKARGQRGAFLLSNGQGAIMDESNSLARSPWIVVADMAGTAERSRILLAAPVSEDEVCDAAADRISTTQNVRIEGKSNRSEVFETTRLGAIILSEKRIDNPSPDILHAALLDFVRQQGLTVLPWTEHWQHWRTRVQYLHGQNADVWPDVTDAALLASCDAWLGPYLLGKSRLSELTADELGHALQSLLTGNLLRDLEKQTPARFQTPAGTSHQIDYTSQAGPTIACRVQELFGLDVHPMIGTQPLTLTLLSPAHRPIQTTKDLPGFWRGSWSGVKSDMKGRYPRHVWPDDPAREKPTTRAKPRHGS